MVDWHCLKRCISFLWVRPLADLGGAHPAHAPQGSQFFRFDIQNFRNVTASGVHTPRYEVHAPLREILDPPLKTIAFWSISGTFKAINTLITDIRDNGGRINRMWSDYVHLKTKPSNTLPTYKFFCSLLLDAN